MSFFNALGITTLLAALVATSPRDARAGTEAPAREYVFGQLRRAGDASSFVRDPRWQPLRAPASGAAAGPARTLVVVPAEVPPGSLRSPAELHRAQDQGQLFMLQ